MPMIWCRNLAEILSLFSIIPTVRRYLESLREALTFQSFIPTTAEWLAGATKAVCPKVDVGRAVVVAIIF